MRKTQFLTIMVLLMMFGCSNDGLINTEQDSTLLEEGNLSFFNGERRSNPNNGISTISFSSNSILNTEYVNDCLPTSNKLLKQGNFSGNLSGFGKINTKLSTYEFTSCNQNNEYPNYPNPIYTVKAEGKLALGSRDYCNITITGNFDISDNTSYGFVYGTFIGSAITDSGVGKLKGLDKKIFEVYGSGKVPSINLDEGTIHLYISNGQ